MEQTVFLSYNNVEPYDKVDAYISNDIEIDSTSGSESVFKDQFIYLIITGGKYDKIEIRVENENGTGASLYISNIDLMDMPLHWQKVLTLHNVDASIDTFMYKFSKRWVAINNVFLIKQLKISGTINVYEV